MSVAHGCLILAPFLALAWVLLVYRSPRLLFPPQRRRAAPWSLTEIFFVLFLTRGLLPIFVFSLLAGVGLFQALYGEAFAEAVRVPGSDRPLLSRAALWAEMALAPVCLVCVLVLLKRTSGTQPYQLGITARRWRSGCLLGLVTAVGISPAVYALNEAVTRFQSLVGSQPEHHPIVIAARNGMPWFDGVAVVLATMIAAPIMEELFFRGVIQRWVAARPGTGVHALMAALPLAAYARSTHTETVLREEGIAAALGDLAGPLVMVLVLALVPRLFARLREDPSAAAVFGSAVLFAAAHSFAWPSPISLFLLGLALGLIAERTQSLVPSIVAHGLFNGIACVQLLLNLE